MGIYETRTIKSQSILAIMHTCIVYCSINRLQYIKDPLCEIWIKWRLLYHTHAYPSHSITADFFCNFDFFIAQTARVFRANSTSYVGSFTKEKNDCISLIRIGNKNGQMADRRRKMCPRYENDSRGWNVLYGVISICNGEGGFENDKTIHIVCKKGLSPAVFEYLAVTDVLRIKRC